MEQWRQIDGFPLYEVSDLGRVHSLRRTFIRPSRRAGLPPHYVTLPTKIIHGWLRRVRGRPSVMFVSLREDGRTVPVRIHRLVLTAFVGACPDGMEGCHADGDPTNNALTNLRWDTHAANIADCARHGRKVPPPVYVGEKHHNSKLTDAQVVNIIAAKPGRGVNTTLAREYGISPTSIARIRSGIQRRFAHDHTRPSATS